MASREASRRRWVCCVESGELWAELKNAGCKGQSYFFDITALTVLASYPLYLLRYMHILVSKFPIRIFRVFPEDCVRKRRYLLVYVYSDSLLLCRPGREQLFIVLCVRTPFK